MTKHRTSLWRASIAVAALTSLITACSSDDSGLSTRNATQATDTTERTDATDAAATTDAGTTPEATDAPATNSPATDATDPPDPPVTDASGGQAERPEGTWTFIRRLEEANPPYDEFVPGQPDLQQWVIHPQCDDGPCDLKVEPGDNGYLPLDWPSRPDAGERSFILELQDDGSYSGIDTVTDSPTCSGSDGSDVVGGAERSYGYQLVFVPAAGGEAPRIEGKLTVNQVPNATGTAAGCIEFHDVQGLVAQPLDYWKGVDPNTLTFGSYDWGGLVIDADDYYLEHTAGLAKYVHFNSPIEMQSTCVDDPCAIPATGVAPGYGDKRGTFHWDAANWDDGVLRSEIDYEDTCVKNGTDEVLVQHGFDVVAKIALSPVVIVDGEVLAWKGTFSSVGTPTAEATAASAEDCFRFYESEAAAASTTQPYFHGL